MDDLLLPAQAWWDAQRFEQPGWQIVVSRDQKVRRIHLHVPKALGNEPASLEQMLNNGQARVVPER